MNDEASCNNDGRTMSVDDDLQRRFDTAKTAIDLESGSAAEVKGRARRRTRHTRVLSVAAVVAIAVLGIVGIRSLPNDDPDFEVVAAAPTVLPTQSANGVIFETDFSQDTGYHVEFTNLWNGKDAEPPAGWDGVKVGTSDGGFDVIGGEGVDGSNALRITWGGEGAQPVLSLGKHLTGDESTGYEELYVRYRVRFPNGFRAGDDEGQLGSWMWGRLWQNTSVDPTGWTQNRADSGYVNFGFGPSIPFTSANATWAENAGDNIETGGGPIQRVDWFVTGSEPSLQPGYFERVWDINTTDRPGQLENDTSQSWHTVEYRFRLASTPTADDGVFEVFFDGVSQGSWVRIVGGNDAQERTGIPTAKLGSGFNFLTFFDQVQRWNEQWSDPGVDGFIWVNDVVVSTNRIGPDYSPAG